MTGSCCLVAPDTRPALDKFWKCVVMSSKFALFLPFSSVCPVFSPVLSRLPKKPPRLPGSLFKFPVRRTIEPLADLTVTEEYFLVDSIATTLESILTLTSFCPDPHLCPSVPPTASSVMHGNRKDGIPQRKSFSLKKYRPWSIHYSDSRNNRLARSSRPLYLLYRMHCPGNLELTA